MTDLLPRIVKRKIDLENEILGLPGMLKTVGDSSDDIRQSIDKLDSKRNEIRLNLNDLRDQLEKLSNSPDFDSTKSGSVRKTMVDCRLLEQLLDRSYGTTLERLKLRAAKRSLSSGAATIEMDEEMQQKFMQLSEQSDLTDSASTKGDQTIAIGNAVLENLYSQSQRAKAILGGLSGIARELKLSKWTAGAINRRLMADKRLVVALFLIALAVVVGAKFLIKRVLGK